MSQLQSNEFSLSRIPDETTCLMTFLKIYLGDLSYLQAKDSSCKNSKTSSIVRTLEKSPQSKRNLNSHNWTSQSDLHHQATQIMHVTLNIPPHPNSYTAAIICHYSRREGGTAAGARWKKSVTLQQLAENIKNILYPLGKYIYIASMHIRILYIIRLKKERERETALSAVNPFSRQKGPAMKDAAAAA